MHDGVTRPMQVECIPLTVLEECRLTFGLNTYVGYRPRPLEVDNISTDLAVQFDFPDIAVRLHLGPRATVGDK